MKIFTGCVTDKGNYREKNQDCAVCRVKKSRKSVLLAACVCDGIGSFAQSEIAASMIANGISRWFDGVCDLFPRQMDEETLAEDMELTIRELNELAFEYRQKYGIDIGCTMSAILMINTIYYVFHVGDSRIYHLSDTYSQITRDEVSMVESNGRVRPLLANFVGKSKELWMNRIRGYVEEKELILLGTDGLFKRLTADDVRAAAERIKKDAHAQKTCEQFLKLVLDRGEKDNVSCVLIYAASV